MRRIGIIGGGISGLSAAYTLEKARRAGASLEYMVFESSPRFGGALKTEHVDGCVIEAGPDSFLTEKTWASDLCRELGLGDQLIASNDARRKTYILVKERLVPIPDGLMFMVPTKIVPVLRSPLFSLDTKLRMAREWFYKQQSAAADDESVSTFVERHYGSEMVDRLADPLLSGVYGGDASELSIRAVLPRFVEMEQKYGSLGRGMLAARKRTQQNGTPPNRPLFTSLKDGMEHIVDALLTHLPTKALLRDISVDAVQLLDAGWHVSAGSRSDHFDALILALPAHHASTLLQSVAPDLSAELRAIRYSSSVTVALGYGQSVRNFLPPGFGFLIPHSEGKHMLAATFVHNKFPQRAPEDQALLRCFLGGSRNEAILDRSDEEIVSIVRAELKQILGLKGEPLFTRVYKWRNAMAQYGVGHLERIERIENLSHRLPCFALAGNAYRGIGVPDCVRSGTQAAEQVLGAIGLVSKDPQPATSQR
jgi:protoporphyrinogen/coproporphyrinogen III oxidase